jgi:subfamily B ATP-binding cassette protein MsbA
MLQYLYPHLHLAVIGVILIFLLTITSSINIFMLKPIFDGVLVKSKAELIASEEHRASGYALTYLKDFSRFAGQQLRDVIRGEASLKEAKGAISRHFNDYLKRGAISDILLLVTIIIIAGVGIKCLSEYGRRLVFLILNLRIMMKVRMDVYEKVMHFSMPFFNEFKTGYLMNRIIGEVSIIQQLVIKTASGFITNVVQIIFFFLIILYIDWKLTLILILFFPPLLFFLDRLAIYLKRYQKKIQELVGSIMAVAQETLAGIRLIIVSNRQEYEAKRYENTVADFQKTMLKTSKYDFLAAPVSEFVTTVIGLGIVVYALKSRVINVNSAMTSGDFIVYIAFMFSMMRPIKQLNTFFIQWQRGMVVAGRVYEILDREPTIKNAENAVDLDTFKDRIEFKNVTFAYRKGIPVLKRISFSIKKGEVVAIVGPSGAGKTTLVDLLPRLYDPQTGEIVIDGVNIKGYTLASLRDKMGIVTQDTILFHDTVKKNIAYGNSKATQEAVEQAAAVANASEFIQALPEKYETIIGERGTRLSGGERQRLCIARAILRDPDILIFDEATSSLDNESEAKVQRAIDNLIRNRTAVVIAHRLSTIKHADRIFVVDEGEIKETGTHDELIEEGGIYKKLYDLQFRDKK